MRQILKLPLLPNGPKSNIAGILPLSGLLDFVDVVTKLHLYELSGRGIAWNWPMTAFGARVTVLLERARLENEHNMQACLLDSIRKCIEQTTLIKTTYTLYRPQRLKVVHIFLLPDTGTAGSKEEEIRRGYWHKPSNVLQSSVRLIHKLGAKWLVVLLGGWVAWVSVIILSILANYWLAVAYLLALPLTGLVVRTFFGHHARHLYNGKPSKYTRMALIAENFNDNNWTLIGNSNLVDSTLNRTLVRVDNQDVLHWVHSSRHKKELRFVLHVLIAVQWGVIVAASALQGWDGIIISVFIVISACTTSFIFTTHDSIAGWLRSNGVTLEKMRVVFSSRRSMFSTMIVVNPDPSTHWLDPILLPSDDRTRWEAVLA